MVQHQPLKIFVIVFNLILLAVTLFINYTASGAGKEWGFLESSTGNISDKYHTMITPSGSTFIIWAFIYIYQGIWIIYTLTLICRKSTTGYLYYAPNFIPMVFYLVYYLNFAFNITWIFLWDREYMIVALVFIALISIALWVSMAISMNYLDRFGKVLIEQDHEIDTRLVRGMIHNGIAMYATWVTIATHLNFAIVLIYEADLADDTASSIMVGVLAALVIMWFVLDNFVLDKFTRYLFTPYIVLHWALIGIIVENWDNSQISSILVAVLLAIGAIATITKVALVIMKSCKNPEPLLTDRAGKHRIPENP